MSTLSPELASRLEQLLAERKRLDEEIERLLSPIAAATPRVLRVLRWFDRETEKMVGSAPLKNIQLRDLQQMFRVEPENPMYDCYEVTDAQAWQLQVYVDVPIQLDKYDYFVEADSLP